MTREQRRRFHNTRAPFRARESQRAYHRQVEKSLGHDVPGGRRVLELGCGLGDLLASTKPSYGVGVDFSAAVLDVAKQRHPELSFECADAETFQHDGAPFDHILLSDLANDLVDVQSTLENALGMAHPTTRLRVHFQNGLWRPALALAEKLGWKSPTPPQNWLSVADMSNLLALAGWEPIQTRTRILIPFELGGVETWINRWLAPLLSPLCLAIEITARPKPTPRRTPAKCSVVIPARNEAGNIEAAVQRLPDMGAGVEILFVEGGSSDTTWETILKVKEAYPDKDIQALRQPGKGKGDAVRTGFAAASGDLFFILDADLTVPPEDLPKFYRAAMNGVGEFINGVRLVYPMEDEAMRFFNMLGNKFFSVLFTWLLGQPIKDTLCGTKVLFREDYEAIAANRHFFGDFDPFGDFDLLFGAAKLQRRIVDMPIRYHARTYGSTNIDRWRHGVILLRMAAVAAKRLKFR